MPNLYAPEVKKMALTAEQGGLQHRMEGGLHPHFSTRSGLKIKKLI